MKHLLIIIGLSVVLSAGGCAHRGNVKKETSPTEQVKVTKELEKKAPPILPETPLLSVEGEKKDYSAFSRPAKRFDMTLKGADLREVLFNLAKESELQMVIEPGVTGVVNLDLRDVTAYDVIHEVCRANQLNCALSGEVVRVTGRKMITRLYYLDYIITSRQGSGTLTATTSTNTSEDSGGGTTSGSSSSTSGGQDDNTNTVSTEETMNIWKTLKEEIGHFLSSGDAKVSITPETGLVAVTDYPENNEMIEKYLTTVEKRLMGQVLLEAKIFEVQLSDSNKYGVNWSAIVNFSSSLTGNLAGGATFAQSLSSGENAFKFGVSNRKVDVLLDAIAKQGQVNLISSPRISTLNNQKAIIRIGTQDVFFRAVITPSTDTTGPITTFSPETITVGVVLSVTPQISRDGRIMLAIHPSISEKTGEAVAPDGNSAPIIDVRETNTVIRMRDSETVLIGGLIQTRTNETVKSVPFLGDIPIVGSLFRNTEQEKKKSELVILITPHIMKKENMREVVANEARKFQSGWRGFHVSARPWLYGTRGETNLVW